MEWFRSQKDMSLNPRFAPYQLWGLGQVMPSSRGLPFISCDTGVWDLCVGTDLQEHGCRAELCATAWILASCTSSGWVSSGSERPGQLYTTRECWPSWLNEIIYGKVLAPCPTLREYLFINSGQGLSTPSP